MTGYGCHYRWKEKMKTKTNAKTKMMIVVSYACVALTSTVLATNLSTKPNKKKPGQPTLQQCANASDTPFNFPNGGDGKPYKATNQDDCCTTACDVLNAGNSDASNECTLNCESYSP